MTSEHDGLCPLPAHGNVTRYDCQYCRLIDKVVAREVASHAECRCHDLEAIAYVDGKIESIAIDGVVLERPDVTRREALQDALDLVRDRERDLLSCHKPDECHTYAYMACVIADDIEYVLLRNGAADAED